jgi:hypothetical protein
MVSLHSSGPKHSHIELTEQGQKNLSFGFVVAGKIFLLQLPLTACLEMQVEIYK